MVSRVARVVAPKKAALKEAEAELAVAMEVRNSFIIFDDLQQCWLSLRSNNREFPLRSQ